MGNKIQQGNQTEGDNAWENRRGANVCIITTLAGREENTNKREGC